MSIYYYIILVNACYAHEKVKNVFLFYINETVLLAVCHIREERIKVIAIYTHEF